MSERDTKRILRIIQTSIVTFERKEKKINNLNVFPVPDGDTGSNMTATLLSAWNNISPESKDPLDILNDFSQGALLGARGNSGVITSQIIKGFYEGFKKVGGFSYEKDKVQIVLKEVKYYAYKSVFKPVEGTILSVVRELEEKFKSNPKSYKDLFSRLLKIANDAVERTPKQLKVLKDAKVVDSGAYGLALLLKGILDGVKGKKLLISDIHKTDTFDDFVKADKNNNIGYCTEFVLTLKKPEKFDEKEFKRKLIEDYKGDSLVLIKENDILKCHVHVKKPGKVFSLAHKYGEFSKIKSDNMASQAAQAGHNVESSNFTINQNTKLNTKELGIVAVSNGEGLDKEFKKYGVDHIVSGGQSMNPSVEDFINLIKKMDNENILLLPNNSNIILTIESVQKIIKDKNIFMLPTKTLQQGLAALYNISKEMVEFNEYSKEIENSFKSISEGHITKAIRDTEMNKISIKNGEYITLLGKDIISSTQSMFAASKVLIDKLIEEKSELITIIYNSDVSKGNLDKIKKYILNKNKSIEIEVIFGGQAVYHLLIFGEK